MHIVERITIDQILDQHPAMIYYGARTCWWTHDPSHLCSVDGTPNGLPCDPRGGVLFQTDDVAGFIRSAQEHSESYGKHAFRAFMAAHHLNCQVSATDPRSTCGTSWDEYNDALDERTGDGDHG